MKKIKELTGSVPVLVVAIIITTTLMFLYIKPASRHIAEISHSVTQNFYLLGGFMLLAMIACLFQTLLVVRLVWGPQVNKESRGLDEEDDDIAKMRAMRVTGTKKALVFFVLIALNMFLFDQIGQGVIITDTRAYLVLTQLRSPNGQHRANAVGDAIMLTGDERITSALGQILDTDGDAREWAAYAAGARKDVALSDSLVQLLKTGKASERAAAAVALARLGDPRLIPLARLAWPHMGKLQGDLIMALGMLGKQQNTTKDDLSLVGTFLVEILEGGGLSEELKRVVIWALGEFNAPEGLKPIERLLDVPSDNATFCTGLEALGKIGSADTSPRLIKALYEIDKKQSCPEIIYRDNTGHEVLICSSANIIDRLLYEIANIGDRRAMPTMEKLADDPSFSERARNMAREIAFQMKYKRVANPSE